MLVWVACVSDTIATLVHDYTPLTHTLSLHVIVKYGETALMKAADNEGPSAAAITDALLKAKADVNAKDKVSGVGRRWDGRVSVVGV